MTDVSEPPVQETTWEISRRRRIEELSAQNRDLHAAVAAFAELSARVTAAREILEERRYISTYVRRVLHALDGT